MPKTQASEMPVPHYHQNSKGKMVECYHKCRSLLLDGSFWFATIVAFPLEHFIWEKIPGFSHLSKLLGL